jgi:Sap, sulfolipid-1-addressing protein
MGAAIGEILPIAIGVAVSPIPIIAVVLMPILGLIAVLIGIRSWRGRLRGDEEPPMPKWMSAIDQFSAGKSLGLGFLLAALNPENLTLTLAAAAQTVAVLRHWLAINNATIMSVLMVVIGAKLIGGGMQVVLT